MRIYPRFLCLIGPCRALPPTLNLESDCRSSARSPIGRAALSNRSRSRVDAKGYGRMLRATCAC
eukprot:1185163-Prorocentrum_minimum.AAC.4